MTIATIIIGIGALAGAGLGVYFIVTGLAQLRGRATDKPRIYSGEDSRRLGIALIIGNLVLMAIWWFLVRPLLS